MFETVGAFEIEIKRMKDGINNKSSAVWICAISMYELCVCVCVYVLNQIFPLIAFAEAFAQTYLFLFFFTPWF